MNRIDQVYRDRGNTWRISPRRIFIKLIRACLIYGNGISYVSYFGVILFFVRSKKAGFFRICEICVEYEEEEEGELSKKQKIELFDSYFSSLESS